LKSFNRFDAQLVVLVEFPEFIFSQRDAERRAFPVAASTLGQEIGKEDGRRV
jgi:hypothetical protein